MKPKMKLEGLTENCRGIQVTGAEQIEPDIETPILSQDANFINRQPIATRNQGMSRIAEPHVGQLDICSSQLPGDRSQRCAGRVVVRLLFGGGTCLDELLCFFKLLFFLEQQAIGDLWFVEAQEVKISGGQKQTSKRTVYST